MTKNRLQYKEINELTAWISSLIDERDNTLASVEDINTKLTNNEYDKNSDIFNPTTKDKLTKELQSLKNSITDITIDMEETKQKLNALKSEKKKLKSEYNRNAVSIRYKSNKTKFSNIEVGKATLGQKITEIKYNVQQDKDFINIYIDFDNDTAYTFNLGMDKIDKLIVKV